MAQSYNLNDVYAIQFANVAAGLLARPDFPASRMSLGQFLDVVQPVALAMTRRIADTVGDMSTAAPPVTDFNTGYMTSSAIFVIPQDQAPPPRYVPPTSVLTPGGARVVDEGAKAKTGE